MKKNSVEVVFLLDRSGSMNGLEGDTIGGFNGMLSKQKSEEGEAKITTVLFDDRCELLHDRINVKGVSELTEKDYFVRGSTALLDAIGFAINKISNVQKQTQKEERADSVLFVITTDGMENASREYSYKQIKSMIEKHKDQYGWEFIFLGANIDAVDTAQQFGIGEDRAVNFHADSEGLKHSFQAIDSTISAVRSKKSISRHWKDDVESDHLTRKSRRS